MTARCGMAHDYLADFSPQISDSAAGNPPRCPQIPLSTLGGSVRPNGLFGPKDNHRSYPAPRSAGRLVCRTSAPIAVQIPMTHIPRWWK